MELTQATHLESEALPFAYSLAKAGRLRVYLRAILGELERDCRRTGGIQRHEHAIPEGMTP